MLKIEEIQSVLGTVTIAPEIRAEIIKKAEELEADKKSDKSTAPKEKNKKQLVVVLKSPEKISPETVAHIFEIGGEDDVATVITKVKSAAVEHNLAQKRKKNIVAEFDDVVHIKRRFAKDAGYMLKSKTDWVQTVVLNEVVQFGGFEKTREASEA